MGEENSQVWAQPWGTTGPWTHTNSTNREKWKQEGQQGKKEQLSKLQIAQNDSRGKCLSLQGTLVVSKNGVEQQKGWKEKEVLHQRKKK